jgi:hypothetical protein
MVLLLEFADQRSDPRFTNKEVMLLTANCSFHLRQDTFQIFGTDDVKTFIVQAYTTNCCPWLDLHLLDALKKKLCCELLIHSDDSTAVFRRRIFHTMKLTVVPDNERMSTSPKSSFPCFSARRISPARTVTEKWKCKSWMDQSREVYEFDKANN